MPKNPYFDKIIPGIALVPDLELETFFATEEGRGLKLLLCKFEKKKSSHSHYGDTAAVRFIQRDNANQEQIQAQIRENSGFIPLKKLIYKAMLKTWILKYNFIHSEDQTILIDKPYTAALYCSYFIETQPLADCINQWKRSFDADPDENLIQIRDLIQVRQLKLVDDTKQKIGFLLASSARSENEMNNLLYLIAIDLYYSKITKADKKELLKSI